MSGRDSGQPVRQRVEVVEVDLDRVEPLLSGAGEFAEVAGETDDPVAGLQASFAHRPADSGARPGNQNLPAHTAASAPLVRHGKIASSGT